MTTLTQNVLLPLYSIQSLLVVPEYISEVRRLGRVKPFADVLLVFGINLLPQQDLAD